MTARRHVRKRDGERITRQPKRTAWKKAVSWNLRIAGFKEESPGDATTGDKQQKGSVTELLHVWHPNGTED